MADSKIVLTERLRREGRWEEASKFKDEMVADLRASGIKRSEASETAWEATSAAFPPLMNQVKASEQLGDSVAEATADALPSNWHNLPTEADFDEEVRWVHQQYINIIDDTPHGRRIYWERATAMPPSTGACSLACWAADNRTFFYKDLLPKTMAKWGVSSSQNDAQIDLQTDQTIAEIDSLLQSIEDAVQAELRADVPTVLQRRVSTMMNEWSDKRYLRIDEGADAWPAMELAICGLINDSLQAFATVLEN